METMLNRGDFLAAPDVSGLRAGAVATCAGCDQLQSLAHLVAVVDLFGGSFCALLRGFPVGSVGLTC